MLRIVEPVYNVDEKQHTLQRAAKLLRTDVNMSMSERRREQMLICGGERERQTEGERERIREQMLICAGERERDRGRERVRGGEI